MSLRPTRETNRRVARFCVLLVTLASLATAFVARPTNVLAVCTYPFLTSGNASNLGDGATPKFGMSENNWTAVGLRPPGNDDWDLTLNRDAAGEPLCVASQLSASAYTANYVDFVVGDFNAG